MPSPLRSAFLALALAALPGPGLVLAQQASPYTTDVFGALRWRTIGPEGNRYSAAVGIPGDPLTYYVGSASGGIWKTTDGGVHWAPIFDDQPVRSIGALAIAPSDPNVIWAGTGESHIRSHVSVGQGVYRSLDAGRTWRLMGLEQTGRIARVVIHPTNPDVVLVCALGHAYGPQPDRGVFRTTDGGATWAKVLFVDETTGCADLVMDPSNPRTLFAGMWQIEIRTWGRTSGGPGSGLFASKDGGITWTRQTGHGLPVKPVGKVTLAMAHTNPQRAFPWSPVICVRPTGAVFDMVYGRELTPLVLAARCADLAASDGIGMLANQGEEAFRLWFDTPVPPGLMRATLESLRRGK